MKSDQSKTKAELIQELQSLRQRVTNRNITTTEFTDVGVLINEGQYKTIAEAAQDAIFIIDRQDIILYVNSFGAALFGQKPLHVIGKHRRELFPAEIADQQHQSLQKIFQSGQPLEFEKKAVFKKHELWLSTRLVPLTNQYSKIYAVLGISRDITKWKQSEEELRESEEQFRTLFESSLNAIGISKGNKVISCNQAMLDVFGYNSVSEFINIPLIDHIAPESKEFILNRMERRKRGETLNPRYEYKIIRKDGEIREIEASTVDIVINGENFVLGTFRDITEYQQTRIALQQNIRDMTVLNTLGQQVVRSLSIDEVVESALDGIFESVQSDLVLLFLRDKNKLFLRGEKYKNPKFRHNNTSIHNLGECLCGLAVREDKAMYSLDICKDPRCTWNKCKHAGFTSFVALPLRSVDRTIGVLGLASKSERDFSQQTTFLETLSSEIAVGLQNAILYEQLMNHSTLLEQEIAERTKVVEALQKSEEKFRSIVENSRDVIMLTQPDGIVSYLSPACSQVLGYQPEELIGKQPWIVHPDDSEFVQKIHSDALSGKKHPSLEYRIKTKAGDTRWVSHSFTNMFAANKLQLIVSIIRDITELKRTEEALQRNAIELQSIFDACPIPLIVVNNERRVQKANKATQVFTGQTEQEILERRGGDVFRCIYALDVPEGCGFGPNCNDCMIRNTTLKTFLTKESALNIETDMTLFDGKKYSLHNILFSTSFFEGFAGPRVVVALEDITYLKRTEKALQQSNDMKELLLDIITHDLKNPANAISGFAELLHEQNPEDQIVQYLNNSSETLLKVLENATALAGISMGEAIEKQEINLNKMINAVISGFERKAKEKNLKIEYKPTYRISINANPILSEIIKNYLSNAIKYANKGKRIVLESHCENGITTVCVKDYGETIPEESRKTIFQRRTRLGNDNRGRGLGLAIVKRIAEAHGGKVWVEPNQPQGNCFYFEIPK